jgi:hypothetical protein
MDISVACFTKKGEMVTRSIAGETLIVPVRGKAGDLDAIFNLNEAGSFIWERIDGHNSIGQIIEALCSEFEVAREEAAKDVLEFAGALEAAGLIEPAGHME